MNNFQLYFWTSMKPQPYGGELSRRRGGFIRDRILFYFGKPFLRDELENPFFNRIIYNYWPPRNI